jgi:thiamine pyrophosphate-dependent acetolactate synthase large subunit-like protein
LGDDKSVPAAEAIGRRAPVELGVIGDVVHTLRALIPRLQAKPGSTLEPAGKTNRKILSFLVAWKIWGWP